MKKSFLTKAVASAGAAILALTMCFSAYAELNVYNTSDTIYKKEVNAKDHTMVIQSYSFTLFNKPVNVGLTSDYYVEGSNFTASTYYACGDWYEDARYRFARVTSYDGSTVIDSDYNFLDVSEETAVIAELSKKPLTSKVSKVYFEGRSTLNDTILDLQSHGRMDCQLTLKHN